MRENLKALRERTRKQGLPGLYLVAVYSYASASHIGMLKDLGYDAFCAYTNVGLRDVSVRWDSKNIPCETSVDNMVRGVHPFLTRVGREKGIPYWPSVFSGWDDRPRAGLESAVVTTGNTPERFGAKFRLKRVVLLDD